MTGRRILYGVVGSGLGHAMRSLVVAQHLRATGHEVRIASSGRALAVFASNGFECLPIHGLDFRFCDGRLALGATLGRLVEQGPRAVRDNFEACRSLVKRWRPNVVLTDFETVSTVLGRWLGVPVISIDHQHVIDRCTHPQTVREQVSRFGLLRAACAAKTWGCTHYIVTTFFFPHVESENTTLVGPILRAPVEAATGRGGDPSSARGHTLVYQTSATDGRLLPALLAQRSGERFVVYGLGRDESHGHVQLRRFDQARFMRDLISARAVITNGGYTTIAEALALRKPVLAVPLGGQPEQELNAAWLDQLGAGRSARHLSAEVIRDFLEGSFSPVNDARLGRGRVDALGALKTALEAA